MADTPEEDGVEVTPSAPVPPPKSTAFGRRRAVAFVVKFLLITFALLYGYRLIYETQGMNRYLFVIGQHVSLTLGFIGDQCQLEGNFNPARRGGTAAFRDEIDAWARGEEAPWPPREDSGEEPPITAWENFLHRQLNIDRDLTSTTDLLLHVRALAQEPVVSNSLENVSERLAALETIATRKMPDGSERLQGSGKLRQQMRLVQSDIETLKAGGSSPDGKNGGAIAELQDRVSELIADHDAFLARRVSDLTMAHEVMGPRVVYIHEAGILRRLEEARAEVNRLRAAVADGEAGAEAQLEEAHARLNAVQEERNAASEAKDEQAERGYSFTFQIIPDCGALQSMIIYLAAVLAFPTTIRKRAIGVLTGLPVLYIVNVFRLSSLAIIGAYVERETFDFFHEVVWQAIYLVFVIAVWLLWMELIVRPRKRRKAVEAVA